MFKVYVGNIRYNTPEQTITKLFSAYGLVDEMIFVTDEKTGEPRGFAFALMPDETAARAAIAALNGRPVNGRRLVVTESGGKTKKALEGAAGTARSGSSRRLIRGARAGGRAGRPMRRDR